MACIENKTSQDRKLRTGLRNSPCIHLGPYGGIPGIVSSLLKPAPLRTRGKPKTTDDLLH